MNFKEAFKLMIMERLPVKLPSWGGYWCWDEGKQTIMIHCKDGKILDIRETNILEETIKNILGDKWIIANKENTPLLRGIVMFDYSEALKYAKQGLKVARLGWNGKGMFIVRQKAYPDGIPCNKQTAEVWGLNEGDVFKCEPYLQMKNAKGSHSMWTPSNDDMFAEDWVIVA